MQFRLDLDTYKQELISSTNISPKVGKPEDYITEQVWFPSKDGTQIPMFLIRKKKNLPTLESVPKKPLITNLYAYGGFGTSSQPEYSPTLMTLLNDMGGMYAVANIRGGGEFGEKWHEAGMKDKRQNVFNDFIGAAEFLIEKRYTDSKNLFIQGGSNGGTLVTAVANQRPGLFAGVIGQVPVTDMLRYQHFTGGHMWADEYGSADQMGVKYLLDYSPYHTVKKSQYPAMLIMTADHDDRVVPLHTYKYVAELQYKTSQAQNTNPIIMRIEKDGGHSGGAGLDSHIQEEADVYAFMAKVANAEVKSVDK